MEVAEAEAADAVGVAAEEGKEVGDHRARVQSESKKSVAVGAMIRRHT